MFTKPTFGFVGQRTASEAGHIANTNVSGNYFFGQYNQWTNRMDDFFGTEEFSSNRTYCVIFSDGYEENNKWTKGTVGLLKNGKQVFAKRFDRPHDCKVSNNGMVTICDWGNTDKRTGDFLVLDETGNEIFRRIAKANLGTCSISTDGHYAIFETYSSDTEDSNKIFIVDIKSKTEISSFDRPFAFIAADIDTEQKQIKLIDNSDFEFITDFNGNQLTLLCHN